MPPVPPQEPVPPDGVAPPVQKKGLAVGGYVLGGLSVLLPLASTMMGAAWIFFLVAGVLSAIAGLVLSVSALAKQTAGRGLAIRGLVLSLLSVLAVSLVASIVLPAELSRKGNAQAAGCGMNLSILGKCVAIYRAWNHDQFPPNLEALMDDGSGGLSPKDLRCPTDGPPDAAFHGTSYFYCAPDGDDETAIIACDIAPVHPRGGGKKARNVLRADLSVHACTESEFQKLLQKPENRRFAEELAKGVTMTPQERVTYIAPRGEK